jgi:hypothetical protein
LDGRESSIFSGDSRPFSFLAGLHSAESEDC